ncbi:MAG TPA: response regulator transcription factor [Dehalococcoidia bacterium]|nr:response regulator transcription factor [Dehalococcoidia bacterium]
MRVLVVDDHALFRDGIRSLLTARGFDVVGEADSGQEAIAKAASLQPDVVLMDVRMPVMGGLTATRTIKAASPTVKIVMLTVSEDDADLFEAIKAGADGYLLKKLRAEEFFDLLEGLERGEAAIPRPLAARILREFARGGAGPVQGSDADRLTQREEEILKLLAQGRSNREIAEALTISENTVKFHTKNILDKLHLRSRAEVVAYASRQAKGP